MLNADIAFLAMLCGLALHAPALGAETKYLDGYFLKRVNSSSLIIGRLCEAMPGLVL